MKSVLISIQPKWCELIASGKKTVEVRKTRPKLETPFKVYIYQTVDGGAKYDRIVSSGLICGKVIGEFVCDRIIDIPYSEYFVDYYHTMPQEDLEATCVCMGYIDTYLLSKNGYGWHISDLVIYDKPRELSEFYILKKCRSCESGYESTACIYDEDCKVPAPITRPPQSWRYVESEEQK